MKLLILSINILVFSLLAGTASASPANKQAHSAKASAKSIKTGQSLYIANQCNSCHILAGAGCRDGVSLDRLPASRTRQFIVDQIIDPETHVKKHATLFNFSEGLMPDPRLNKEQAMAIADYILSVNRRKKSK